MDYDTIVIGSGPGGLTAALALAQSGQRVLVCEQHEVPGGWTHSFTLNGYRFSPGVHYIGDLHPDGHLRRIYEGLGVSQDLEFCELNPDGYDHIFIGEERFDIPTGKETFIKRLQARFPQEAAGIQAYFNTITRMMAGLRNLGRATSGVKGLTAAAGAVPDVLRWARRSGLDLIAAHVSDPVLQGILMGQSGDHGMPPSQVSAFVHAGITHHYLNGAWYPRGGGFAIPRAFVRALKRAGGEIMLNARVVRILLQDGRVTGIRLADGQEISASRVISNADPGVTFGTLLAGEAISPRLRRKLEGITYSTSALSLFFAVDMDLRAAGLDSGNFWFYEHSDVDALYQQGLTDYALHAETPPATFLTVTTLKDPSKMHSGHHTLEAFTFVGYEAFQRWAGGTPGNRPADYEALKEDLAWCMMQALDRRVPGISQHVVFWNLGTPLSNEYYVNATRGNLYGIAKSRTQVGPGAFPIRSEIPGLWMVGASTLSHGVSGATASGMQAAQQILQCRQRDLLSQNGPTLRIYPSEQPDTWPEPLQAHIQRGEQG
ncbi:MAG: NAD(P)/FAD-dependent oxidoreductase [Anaerolineales bacterium]